MKCIMLSLSIEMPSDLFMFSVFAILATVLMVFVGYKLLQIMQLAGYKIKGFFKWFKETKFSYYSRLFMLSFLTLSSMLMTNVLLKDFFVEKTLSYISMFFFILFSSLFITNLFSAKQKTPLKYTKRMTRLLIVFAVLVAIVTWWLQYVGYNFVPYLSFGLIGLLPVLLPPILIVAYFIMYPIEKLISNSYIKKAKVKLSGHKKLKVIGITGSYGKTSVKNILGTILSEKYKVCATPASYNTPLGLAKTILSNLEEDDEIFIAEMGAKQRFDINELCEIVKPEIGIITGIGSQHLLTFGTLENVAKTKEELAKYMQVHNGKLFINVDFKTAQNLADNYKKAIKSTINDIDGIDLVAKNIKTTKTGSTFDLCFGDDVQECSTILLGEHNISNILLASRVALELGLTLKMISDGISKLATVSHRLEIVKSTSTYTIIDDAYNSSVEGSKASLNVLSKFEGKKFVITPGLVELGKEQFNLNFEFGRDMSGVCDYVIIDSVINYDAISSGLIFGGFDESHIIQVGNLSQAVEMLGKLAQNNDVVLFENDLPDNYS